MVPSQLRQFLLSQRIFAVALLLVIGWPLVLAVVNAPLRIQWTFPQMLGAAYVLARLVYGVALVLRTTYVGLRSGYVAGRE